MPEPAMRVVEWARSHRSAPEHVERERVRRLTEMYERLRTSYEVDDIVPSTKTRLPEVDHIAVVEDAALVGSEVYSDFFRMLDGDADLDASIITFHRRMLTRTREPGRARAFAQVLQHTPGLRPITDVCLAISALREPVPVSSWQLFTRNDLGFVLKHAPVEYVRCAIAHGFGPHDAAAAIDAVASGEVPMNADAETWLEVALLLFSGGFETQSAYAAQRADQELDRIEHEGHRDHVRGRIEVLRSWFGRAERAAAPVPLPAGEVAVALQGGRHPDARLRSEYALDQIDTLSVLGHLVRHQGARFTGDDAELTELAGDLQRRTPAPLPGEARPVRLVPIDRDLSEFGPLPADTWTVVTSWFVHPLHAARTDAALDPRLNPVFVSFAVDEAGLARPGVVDHLRAHAPIGCRDWASVDLLAAADVPAFFSGALAPTAADVVPTEAPAAPGSEIAAFDLPPEDGARGRSVHWPLVLERSFARNLFDTVNTLTSWRREFARVVTGDVRQAVTARALGIDVDLRPEQPGTSETTDLGALSDADLAALRRGTGDKLAALFGAILAGQGRDEVYAVWREVCAADVAEAEKRRANVADLGTVDFDLNALCNRIRAHVVVVERSEPAGAGAELNLEFSLDAKYKPKLDVVLDSVVTHTDRPVRAFVLSRQHGRKDHARMARLFPTVSFVWIPTDDVDYGPIAGKVPWASFATMDRTLLPLILPDVDRMLHLDLDLLITGDIAELFDTPFEGNPLVAILEPQLCYRSGYDTIRRTAHRLRLGGEPDLAAELLIRVAERVPFDFEVFNAGVMVMNLDMMRREDFCARFLPYVQRYGVNGQEVLNIYVGPRFVHAERKWNLNGRLEFTDDTRIVHWAGPYKPWKRDRYVGGRELWDAAEQQFRDRTAALD
ncbi:MAG TPA: glycosyltransferase [Jatrophihabitans sp.]